MTDISLSNGTWYQDISLYYYLDVRDAREYNENRWTSCS